MDSSEDDLSKCNSQVGISTSDVESCVADDSALVQQYLDIDAPIQSTPTVHINGKKVKTSYSAIKSALCSADPSLKGCSSEDPNGADEEITEFCTVSDGIVA